MRALEAFQDLVRDQRARGGSVLSPSTELLHCIKLERRYSSPQGRAARVVHAAADACRRADLEAERDSLLDEFRRDHQCAILYDA